MELLSLKLGYEKENNILVKDSVAFKHFGDTRAALNLSQ